MLDAPHIATDKKEPIRTAPYVLKILTTIGFSVGNGDAIAFKVEVKVVLSYYAGD